MPKYKNCSGSSYRFYGVLFHPNEVHFVPGSISHPKFIVTDEPETGTTAEKSEKIDAKAAETSENEVAQQIPVTETEETTEGTKRGRRSTKGE